MDTAGFGLLLLLLLALMEETLLLLDLIGDVAAGFGDFLLLVGVLPPPPPSLSMPLLLLPMPYSLRRGTLPLLFNRRFLILR